MRSPNRVLFFENVALAVGGVPVAIPPYTFDSDVEILEIVPNVFDPSDTNVNGANDNTKDLYEGIYCQIDTTKRRLTSGQLVPIRAIGGSSALPGKDWQYQARSGEQMQITLANMFGAATGITALRVSLTIRVFDPNFDEQPRLS